MKKLLTYSLVITLTACMAQTNFGSAFEDNARALSNAPMSNSFPSAGNAIFDKRARAEHENSSDDNQTKRPYLRSESPPSRSDLDILALAAITQWHNLAEEPTLVPAAKDTTRYACDYPECPKNYSTEKRLNTHKLRHKGGIFLCPIAGCTESFRRRTKLTPHLISVHGKKPFKCLKCPNAYALEINLIKHLNNHPDIKPYACPFCAKPFKRKDVRDKHARRMHEAQPLILHNSRQINAISTDLRIDSNSLADESNRKRG